MGIEDTIDEKAKQLANQNDVATSGEVTEIINGMLKQSEIDKQKEEERIRKYNSLPSVLMRTIKRKSVYMSLIAITAVSVWSSIYFSDYNVAGRKGRKAIAAYVEPLRNSDLYGLVNSDNELEKLLYNYNTGQYAVRQDLKERFNGIRAEIQNEIRNILPKERKMLENRLLYILHENLNNGNNPNITQEEWDSKLKEAEALKTQMEKHNALSKRYLK